MLEPESEHHVSCTLCCINEDRLIAVKLQPKSPESQRGFDVHRDYNPRNRCSPLCCQEAFASQVIHLLDSRACALTNITLLCFCLQMIVDFMKDDTACMWFSGSCVAVMKRPNASKRFNVRGTGVVLRFPQKCSHTHPQQGYFHLPQHRNSEV